jgi:hypothetical protein
MRYFTYLFFLLISFSSCELFKTVNKSFEQKTEIYVNTPQKFNIEKNQIVINIQLNNKEEEMYFDTRAPNVLFLDKDKWTDTLDVVSSPEIFSPKVPGGERLKRNFVQIKEARCELFSATNWLVAGINNNWKCNNTIGILGHNEFSVGSEKERYILQIDFDNKQLTLIEEVPNGWQPVKSKYKLGYITIYLKINDDVIPFGMDTGFGGSLLIPKKNITNSIKACETLYTIYGDVFQVAGGNVISDTLEIKKIDTVAFSEKELQINSELFIAPDGIENLAGIEFIKNYNWILDYKHKRVYIQERNTNIIEFEKFFMKNFAASFNFSTTPVEVRTVVKGETIKENDLQLGDKILSVNSTNISEIPVCDREELIINELNKSDTVKLVIERYGNIEELVIF